MNVLLTGASGFIGSHLRDALQRAGHAVTGVGRRRPPAMPADRWRELDFASATPEDWRRALAGIDAVVNAAGIFKEGRGASFDAVHVRGACRLFDACVAARVVMVVQVSALGADEAAETAYHRSKRSADAHLLALPLDAAVVMPSLVFGTDGASARLLLALAALPVLVLPAGGRQPVQPIHVDDAVQAVVALLQAPSDERRGRRIPLVGPQPLAFGDYLRQLRQALQLPPARALSMPAPAMRWAARAGDALPGSLFDTPAWQMLQRGNAAAAAEVGRLLGHAPRAATDFVRPGEAPAWRDAARLAWVLPLLRLSLAFVWLLTAAVSFGLYPAADSFALLQRTGVPPAWQPLMLYGAAGLDLLLGLLTLWPPPAARRSLWLAQAALILFYTAVISWRLPEFWLHPYGPLSKNLPMLAVLAALLALEPRKARAWNT
jgi:nucleoside-diphosphate-sugar epimerase